MKSLLIILLFTTYLFSMSVQEKKRVFIDKVLPAIEKIYNLNTKVYEDVKLSLKDKSKQNYIAKLKTKYKVSTDEELLMSLKPFPISIALAQAAIESAWGTSRFYREANNIFGVWAFGKNTPRIAAKEKRKGKTIWVKKYNSLEDSINDYYLNIGRGFAYKKFRELNMKSLTPYELVKELKMYSEKREVYSKELESIIRYNKFTKYDKK